MGKPNILLITSDQQHWNTLGCLNSEISTPNLDRLASEGMLCNRAYCPNPTCTPTRASIITGKYPSQHGAWTLGTKLSEKEHTIGEDFSAANYKTALIGKAHFQPLKETEEYKSLESYPIMQDLEFWKEFNGPFYGFDHIELARNHTVEPHIGQHYALWLEEKGCDNWRDYFRPPTGNLDKNARHKWDIPEKYHYNAWIAERTNALLQEYKDNEENFLLWASFFDPHPPYFVPEPWDVMYDPEKVTVPSIVEGEHDNNPPHFQLTQQEDPDFSAWAETGYSTHGLLSHLISRKDLAKDIAVYYGMVSMMDSYIGKILDKLDELGLAEKTLVVFTTDHGHLYGHHGMNAKGPFHYEDLIRVPFIARYPRVIPSGERSDALLSLVDLAPTFLNMVGLDIPCEMTGVDQGPVLSGRMKTQRDHVVVENRHEPTSIHLKTYIDERYKITIYYNQEYGEIFDLHQDPGEVNNLWNDNNLKTKLLKKLIFAEMGKEPISMPRISGA